MIKKTTHILNLIKSKVLFKDPKAEIILFGSHAKGTSNKNSDYDILILLNRKKVNRDIEKEFREALFDVELETGQPISTLVFSKNDWEERHSVTPLYRNIKNDGVRL